MLIALALAALSITAAPAATTDPVRAAVVSAATARLGAGVEVAIESLQVTATSIAGALVARPEPGARLGRPSVFALTLTTRTGPRRVGSAVAVLTAVASCLVATRELHAGQVLSAADLVETHRVVADAPLKPMPVFTEAVGASVTGTLQPGDVVTSARIRALPLVRSGQQVTVRAVVGAAEVRGIAVAVESGLHGAMIRVVNPDSRRTLVARVVGAGEVEVVHGS